MPDLRIHWWRVETEAGQYVVARMSRRIHIEFRIGKPGLFG